MASSASGQDERNCALWLVTWAGKMEWSCPLGTTRCIPQAQFPQKPYNKSFIEQVCSVKMAGYWPHSFFASLWTSTSSQSINTQKKNLANIQPSWPHTWSITHTYSQDTIASSAVTLKSDKYLALFAHSLWYQMYKNSIIYNVHFLWQGREYNGRTWHFKDILSKFLPREKKKVQCIFSL